MGINSNLIKSGKLFFKKDITKKTIHERAKIGLNSGFSGASSIRRTFGRGFSFS